MGTDLDSQGNGHLAYFDLFLALARRWGVHRARSNASLICLQAPHAQGSRWQVYLRKPHIWLVQRYRKYRMSQARASGMRMADSLVTVGYAGVGHKANPDHMLRRWSYYCDDRAAELEILRNDELCKVAQDAGVEIINFKAI